MSVSAPCMITQASMATVATTTPLASYTDPTVSLAESNDLRTTKRKRLDQKAEEHGKRPQNHLQHSTIVKPDVTREKQPQEGGLERNRSRGRQPSLRHVKNSTEVLRQRSARRATQAPAVDSISGGREGRQFTVANVGNNGKIYLR